MDEVKEGVMAVTVIGILVLVAFAMTIAAAMGRGPLWVAVLLLTVVEMLRVWPRG